MPIRFRCRYCNQLMGISRRKAGSPVRCPTCHAEVVVPESEGEANPAAPPAQPIGEVPAPVFERSDFEAFLNDPAPAKPAERLKPSEPLPPSPFETELPAAPAFAMPTSGPRTQPPGLVLSPTQATWLTVVVILLVAFAFGAGLLVGHYWI